MAGKNHLKSSFAPVSCVEAFYTGTLRVDATQTGSHLLTPCGNLVKVTDLKSGQQVRTLGQADETTDITCLKLIPGDKALIVAYKNTLLSQWNWEDDAASKQPIRTWKSLHNGPILVLEFDHSGRYLATGSGDHTAKIWDLQLQYCTHNLKGAQGIITALKFVALDENSPGLLVGSGDGMIKVWDLKISKIRAQLQQHSGDVTQLILNENFLYSFGRDQIVSIWNRENWTLWKNFPLFESISDAILFDGKILTAGDEGKLNIFDAKTGKMIRAHEGRETQKDPEGKLNNFDAKTGKIIRPNENLISPLGILQLIEIPDSILVVSADQNLHFCDKNSLKCTKILVGNNDEVNSVNFFGPKNFAVATNSSDLKIYDRSNLNCHLVSGHSEIILSVSVRFPFLATGSKDNSVRIWFFSNEKNQIFPIGIATGHTNSIPAVKFAPLNGKFVASVSEDSTLKIWKMPKDFENFEKIENFENFQKEISTLNAIGSVIAHSKDPTCVDISPNDQLVATGSLDKTVKIWRLDSKGNLEPGITLSSHKRGIWDVQFSPVDQVVATASGDFTIKIFALADGDCVKTFEGHEAAVVQVRFFPTGLQLISSDTGGFLKLWTIKTNECVKTYEAHQGKIWALDVDSEGNFVATGGTDSRVVLWKDMTEEEKEEASRKTEEKILQDQELSNLIHSEMYDKALKKAIALGRPFAALNCIRALISSENGEKNLESILKFSFEEKEILSLLDFVVDWNTNSRNSNLAQKILSVIFGIFSPDEISKIPRMKEIFDALIPYTERHFDRLTRMRQQAHFLNYTRDLMNDKIAEDPTESFS